MKDTLGDRMKDYYENRTRTFLPRRTFTVIRLDGKAFHTYTKGLIRPFDLTLIDDMDTTAAFLCKEIQGAKYAFVQSDEISIILTDYDKLETDAWYDGNIQKMASVSASLATAKFNELRPGKLAFFDSRVFTIPNIEEVVNYVLWRQQDTVRNSISSTAQSLYSSKELHGKSSNVQQEMIFQKGMNWNDFDPKLKRGRIIMKVADEFKPQRTKWESFGAPEVTKDRTFYKDLLPTV